MSLKCCCSPHCTPFSHASNTSELTKKEKNPKNGWSEIAPWNINAYHAQPLSVPPCSMVHTAAYTYILLPVPSVSVEKLDTRGHHTPVITFLRATWGSSSVEPGLAWRRQPLCCCYFPTCFPFKQWKTVCRYRRLPLLETMLPTTPTFHWMVSVYAAENKCRHPLEHWERKEKGKLPTFLDRLARKHRVVPSCS